MTFIAICNKIDWGDNALNSDESDKPPGSGGQNDDDIVDGDWVSVLESALEALASDTENANAELIEELEAALEAFRSLRN